MTDLLYFDAFTQIGPRLSKHPEHAWKLSEVLDEMAHCSISGALVANTMSVRYDLMFSNLELSSRLEEYGNLFAIWNVMPHQTGEFPEPEALGKSMRRHDVRAVTLFPQANGWNPFTESSRPLLDWLEKNAILTIIHRREFANFGEIERLIAGYPNLPFLLMACHWADQRLVLPLMAQYKNLHLSFEQFQINRGIEDFVGLGYEDRLLYLSNSPIMSMGAHRSYIDYAEVPEETRAKIAGGNLTRLLRGQKPPAVLTNGNEDAIMTAARQGKPLPVPVIDMHMHILHEGMNGGGGSYRMKDGGPRETFRVLERFGCIGGGFMSWNGTVGNDAVSGNACTTLALDAAPKGYWGLGTFDPTHYTQSELERLIPELYADKRFIGIKPYVMAGVEYHHKSYEVLWKYGNERRFYAGIHRVRNNDFQEVITLAEKYPNITWVVYHCGVDYKTADMAIECMKKFPNVYGEITMTSVTSGIIDYLARHAGAERILYGSDLPMRDPRQQLGWVVFSRLSYEDKKKVLAENAFKVIEPHWDRLPEHNRPIRA